MTPEIVYRIAALVISVVYMTVRSVYERQLGRGSKWTTLKGADAQSRRELMVVSYGIMPQWLYMLTPWVDFAAMGLPGWLRWVGGAVAVSGLALFMWTHAQLAGNWSPLVERARAGTLITGGPYRWVRHPMYSSFFLFNIGLLVLMSNWIAGLPAVLTFAWMYRSRVGREERIMLDQFGDDYAAYASRTGRVIPGVGRSALG